MDSWRLLSVSGEPDRAHLQGQMPDQKSCRVGGMLVFSRIGFWSERVYLKIELS